MTKRGKHNKSKTKLFERWASMHSRCSDNYIHKQIYFEKGISVCNEWSVFLTFEKWAIENGFKINLHLDRRDNDKGYSPDNCRWITQFENNLNRSNTIFVNYNGEKIALALLNIKLGWDKKFYRNIRDRLSIGWDIHRAIDTHIISKTRKKTLKIIT